MTSKVCESSKDSSPPDLVYILIFHAYGGVFFTYASGAGLGALDWELLPAAWQTKNLYPSPALPPPRAPPAPQLLSGSEYEPHPQRHLHHAATATNLQDSEGFVNRDIVLTSNGNYIIIFFAISLSVFQEEKKRGSSLPAAG